MVNLIILTFMTLPEYATDFKKHHLILVELTEDDDALIVEQAIHDDPVAALTVRIMTLADSTTTSTKAVSARELLVCSCECLESRLPEISTALTSMIHVDVCKLQLYQEQSLDFLREMEEISNTLLSLTLEESDDLPSRVTHLEKRLFDCSLCLKKLLHSGITPLSSLSHPDPKGVKLPKPDVPQFSDNILHWTRYWEQFCISVHEHSSLSNAEKFVYL